MVNERKHAGDRPLRPPRAARRPEFDVMRALVVAGLVVFHSAGVFAVGASWFVKGSGVRHRIHRLAALGGRVRPADPQISRLRHGTQVKARSLRDRVSLGREPA